MHFFPLIIFVVEGLFCEEDEKRRKLNAAACSVCTPLFEVLHKCNTILFVPPINSTARFTLGKLWMIPKQERSQWCRVYVFSTFGSYLC